MQYPRIKNSKKQILSRYFIVFTMRESIFEIYSSKQEYAKVLRDRFDRILSYSIERSNFKKPVVSDYLVKNGFKPIYPNGKKFAVALSHDIDVLYINVNLLKSSKNLINGFIRMDANLLSKSLMFFRKKKKILADYDVSKLIELNEKYCAKSSFYFLAVDKNNIAYNYSINNLKSLFKLIEDSENEIGLHGSYSAYNDIDQLTREKQELEYALDRTGLGYRNHNLNFDVRTTWSILEESGLKYDTTYGLADHVGFRNGMCHPFQPYDFEGKRFYNILEIPLHCMDVTLFKYMKLSFTTAFELFTRLVAEVEKVNGVFTFLWHNTNMTGEMREFYEKCLNHLAKRNAWITSSINIYHWWRENDYSSQINEILKECI